MKINEFIEKYKKLSLTQSVKSLLATKKYLSYTEKQQLVNDILNKIHKYNAKLT